MASPLTDQQEEALSAHQQKWIEIGLNTDRLDRTRATQIIHGLQEKVLQQPKTPVFFARNPIEAWMMVIVLYHFYGEIEEEALQSLGPSSQGRDEIWGQIWWEPDFRVRARVWRKVGQINSGTWGQVWQKVGQINDRNREQIKNAVWDHTTWQFERGPAGEQAKRQFYCSLVEEIGQITLEVVEDRSDDLERILERLLQLARSGKFGAIAPVYPWLRGSMQTAPRPITTSFSSTNWPT